MAAFLASKLVTRPDLRNSVLPSFVAKCCEALADQNSSSFYKLGCIRALELIWKHGRRQELLPLSYKIVDSLLTLGLTSTYDCLMRKLAVKLLQRLGLAFLPPKVAAWRYQRGSRSLAVNMNKNDTKSDQKNIEQSELVMDTSSANQNLSKNTKCDEEMTEEEDEEEVEAAEHIENVIEELLKSLKDTDTVVRYSAAKGVGRVTSRLSRGMGYEVWILR